MSQGTSVSYMKELHSDSALSTMIELHSGVRITYMLQAVAELGIADQLAAGPLPVDELAQKTDSDADALYRVLRALAGKGIFTEVSRRVFALTALSEVLRSDHPNSLRDAFHMHGQKFMHDAYAQIGHTVRTGQPAFEHVNGTSLFEYVAQRPELQELFGKSMGKANRQIQLAAVESYDLTGVRTLVAVGGAQGHVLADLLTRYPGMRGVYVDGPRMALVAEQVLRAAGVLDSVDMVSGDYLESVPPGGDVYLVSHVLHQLGDDDTVKVLTNIREAMADGGRVMIVNAVIPEGDVPHPTKILDSTMLVLGRSRDRTEAEFAEVLRKAGLRLVETTGRALPSSVVVAEPS
ncbi:methyltransferase [Streptomyces roseirectus]|uniref:Methyltransferase n=1 Tax=Streptomyces roseirectus TaxID=2768066 RepID=A0A7H0IPF6_9ACTN|nr:methyltransferase [Streptomyces roseirectus]QNP74672.1 methyltransferase [Streptomyces roseirectus]